MNFKWCVYRSAGLSGVFPWGIGKLSHAPHGSREAARAQNQATEMTPLLCSMQTAEQTHLWRSLPAELQTDQSVFSRSMTPSPLEDHNLVAVWFAHWLKPLHSRILPRVQHNMTAWSPLEVVFIFLLFPWATVERHFCKKDMMWRKIHSDDATADSQQSKT